MESIVLIVVGIVSSAAGMLIGKIMHGRELDEMRIEAAEKWRRQATLLTQKNQEVVSLLSSRNEILEELRAARDRASAWERYAKDLEADAAAFVKSFEGRTGA